VALLSSRKAEVKRVPIRLQDLFLIWASHTSSTIISNVGKFFHKLFNKEPGLRDEDKKTYHFRIFYPLRVFPFFNFFWDLFFDESPVSRDSVKSLMDILGLVNALMLGVVISILSANSYDDMVAADERYATDPQLAKYWNTWYDLPPSVRFQRDIYNSMIFLFVCLMVIICTCPLRSSQTTS